MIFVNPKPEKIITISIVFFFLFCKKADSNSFF